MRFARRAESPGAPAAVSWVPLTRALLCLDCGAIWPGGAACPACGGRQWQRLSV